MGSRKTIEMSSMCETCHEITRDPEMGEAGIEHAEDCPEKPNQE